MATAAAVHSASPVAAAASARVAEHQGVPLGEDLVVEPGPRPVAPGPRTAPPGPARPPRDGRRSPRRGRSRMLVPSQLPARGDAVPLDGGVGVGCRPPRRSRRGTTRRTCPPTPFGVGVLGREEARRAGGAARAGRSRWSRRGSGGSACLAGDLPGVQVHAGQQRLVVEHLLEVRHQPAPVGGVAGEAAAEVVVDAAGGHGVERERAAMPRPPRRRCGGGGAAGCRSTWSGGTWAPARSHRRAGRPGRAARSARRGERPRCRGARPRALSRSPVAMASVTWVACSSRSLRRVRHTSSMRWHSSAKPSCPPRRDLREVGPGEEGPPVGQAEHRHRPAADAGHGLHRVHVDGVDVGALLPVDLDVDEQVVHERSDLGVLERLVGHDVAPVARRVADRHAARARHAGGRCSTPRRPTGTSRPGCRRAGAGTGWSRSARRLLMVRPTYPGSADERAARAPVSSRWAHRAS